MFSFDSGSPRKLFPTHTVLITGAYTNTKGEHILIAYDNNIPSIFHSSEKIVSGFVISEDWSEFHELMYPDIEMGSIQWTDDFSHFRSFDINGKGPVLAWYQSFFRHIANIFVLLRQMIMG